MLCILLNLRMESSKTVEPVTQVKKEEWFVPISECAGATVNQIRRIVDTMKIEPNAQFDFISLSIGKFIYFLF